MLQRCRSRNLAEETLKIKCFLGPKGPRPRGCAPVVIECNERSVSLQPALHITYVLRGMSPARAAARFAAENGPRFFL